MESESVSTQSESSAALGLLAGTVVEQRGHAPGLREAAAGALRHVAIGNFAHLSKAALPQVVRQWLARETDVIG